MDLTIVLQAMQSSVETLEHQSSLNNMYKPYLIRTPDFDPTSGGIRVMWGLFGWLLAKGQIAYLNTKINIPSIGVYPEIYHGNDMESETVVRYILQKPGMMATMGVPGPTNFPSTDKIYVFSKLYDVFGVKNTHVLFLPIINIHLFKDHKRKRTKTCYLVGKGANTYQHPEDSIELTRYFAADQKALADLLNDCHTLYCYDPVSAMMDIARLCGCTVKYLGGIPRDSLELYEPGIDGLDFGEPIEKFNSDYFRSRYLGLVKKFEKNLDIFIEETQ